MATKKKPPAKDRRRDDQTWLKANWRPMMAWQYFAICLFDFLIAPIFFAWFSWFTKTTMMQWTPLTLQGGGLYHLSMGAIIGVTSYAKSQERISNVPYRPSYGQYNQHTQYQQEYQNEHQPSASVRPRQTTKIVQSESDPEL